MGLLAFIPKHIISRQDKEISWQAIIETPSPLLPNSV